MLTISIIGAGNVGSTLGRLLAGSGYTIKEIYSRTRASAERARLFIGTGELVTAIDHLSQSDVLLVATNDDALRMIGAELLRAGVVRSGTIVFHCSGSVSSSVFDPLRAQGASIGSAHPIKTFTSRSKDIETFAGTWCGIEGDDRAIGVLDSMFEALGGNTFRVDPRKKVLYHTAMRAGRRSPEV